MTDRDFEFFELNTEAPEQRIEEKEPQKPQKPQKPRRPQEQQEQRSLQKQVPLKQPAAGNSGTGRKASKQPLSEWMRLLLPLIPILLLLLLILLLEKNTDRQTAEEESTGTTAAEAAETLPPETTVSEEDLQLAAYEEQLEELLSGYTNLGIVSSGGSVNFRSSADTSGKENVIGQLSDGEIVEKLGEEGSFWKVRSGDQTGYVSSAFLTGGEEGRRIALLVLGKEAAEALCEPAVVITAGGYVNLRSAPDAADMTNIIGLLNNGAAFELLEDQGEFWLVSSGGLEGYVSSQFCRTGEEALSIARRKAGERAVITTEVLNIRSAPEFSDDNIIGRARAGERYEILSQENGWAEISCPYLSGANTAYISVSDNNTEICFCLDEARNRDLREMALTQFDHLVVCKAEALNIRKETVASGLDNICGKFLKGAGANLLETVETSERTWYRIRSGNVTGYVAAEYCAVGTEARELALENASLTARINAESLNVRSVPSTEGNEPWTSVVSGQAYHVLNQLDGWVEIELDAEGEDPAYISTRDGNVDLTYGLTEAIEYFPALEAANRQAAFRNKIVNYACQFVGNPYVWGGTSLTNGCDCSGFVQSVLKHFGIYIERSSYYQATEGTRVTSDKMKPGDLIFYASSSGTVNHVGMYIGNGYMVNAASRKAGIKIYRWNYRTPVAIRDVIGDRVE